MTLIQDIQDGAVDTSINLSSLLRKTQLLAARLHYAPLSEWAANELNGYKEEAALPDYRRMQTRLMGSFNSYRWRIGGHDIPDSALPEGKAEQLKEVALYEPVASYEELLRSSEKSFQMPLPMELAATLSNRVFEHSSCTSVWREIPRTRIAGLLDAIRNRLLAFAIDLERQFPDYDAPKIASADPGGERIGASFTMNILGDNNVVNAQGHHVKQVGGGQISKGDLGLLEERLRKLEVANDDILEVVAILKSEEPPRDMTRLPPRASAWMGKMVTKAANGTWHVAVHTAGALLAEIVGKYWGFIPH